MAADISSGITVYDSTLSSGVKELVVVTAATAGNGDYFTINLPKYGIKTFLKCVGTYQSTENSVAIEIAFATSESSGDLTVTLDSTAGSDKKRIAVIRGL